MNNLENVLNHYIMFELKNLKNEIENNNAENGRNINFEDVQNAIFNKNDAKIIGYEFIFRNDDAIEVLESMFFLEGLNELNEFVGHSH